MQIKTNVRAGAGANAGSVNRGSAGGKHTGVDDTPAAPVSYYTAPPPGYVIPYTPAVSRCAGI
jgi:hypothetical protein